NTGNKNNSSLGDTSSSSSSISSGSSSITGESSNAISIIDKLKNKLSDLWNTDFIQSFAGAIQSSFGFLKNFVITIGNDISRNFANTWKNIEGNLKTSINNMSYLWTSFWTNFSATTNTWGPTITTSFSNL